MQISAIIQHKFKAYNNPDVTIHNLMTLRRISLSNQHASPYLTDLHKMTVALELCCSFAIRINTGGGGELNGCDGMIVICNRKSMENLIEPLQVTEEILNKLGYDFIRRYELKQSINPTHLKHDTLFLLQQLRLYSRSIRQLKVLGVSNSMMFDQKFNEVVFKVLQCLSKVVEKLVHKCSKLQLIPKFEQALCELCGSNLNSKKIKNVQRQIFDYFPILGREQLTEKESIDQYHHPLDNELMNEEVIQKKMLNLQRNLEDRRSGLERSIQEFQSFRNDLILGLPRLNAQDGFQKFNVKQHVFQMGAYFHQNLKQIQTKISGLKAMVKKPQDQSVQCCLEDSGENSKNMNQLDNARLSCMRAESEVKKLLEIKSKLEENIKSSQIEITSLKEQLHEFEQTNIVLKQQFYLEKIKKVPRERHNKPILFNWEQKPRKIVEPSLQTETSQPTPPPALELDVCTQISNQIAQIKTEIESSGTKMEDFVPIFKSSVKKAIQNFIKHRMSTNLDRKKLQFDTNEEDSVPSYSKNKIHGSSFKRVSNYHHKRDPNSKASSSIHELSTEFAITPQFNYKFNFNHHKSSSKRISILDQKLLQGIDMKTKKVGISLYKKSLLQTEGNLKPKRLKTTLSSVSSDLKDNLSVHQQSLALNNQKLQEVSQFYRESITANVGRNIGESTGKQFRGKGRGNIVGSLAGSIGGSIGGNVEGLFLGENSIRELMQSKSPKLNPHRKKKKNISCQDLASLCRKSELLRFENDKNLIQIKRINGKMIPNELILDFLQPKAKEDIHQPLENNTKQHKTENPKKNQKKQNKRHITKLANPTKKAHIKTIVTLKLDQINFLTYFFTLMARAHVANPQLYSQLKKEIFQPFKKECQLQQSEESMLRELISNIIIQHRKCGQIKEGNLCQHLFSFIEAFQYCVD